MDDIVTLMTSIFSFLGGSLIILLVFIYKRDQSSYKEDRIEHKEELKAQSEINKSIQENLTALTFTVVEEKGKIKSLEREVFKKK